MYNLLLKEGNMSDKKKYEKPELKSEEILERVALECGKEAGSPVPTCGPPFGSGSAS